MASLNNLALDGSGEQPPSSCLSHLRDLSSAPCGEKITAARETSALAVPAMETGEIDSIERFDGAGSLACKLSWQEIWAAAAQITENHWHLKDIGLPTSPTLRQINRSFLRDVCGGEIPAGSSLDELLLVVPWNAVDGQQIGVEISDEAGVSVQLLEIGEEAVRYWPAQKEEGDTGSKKLIVIGVGVDNVRVATRTREFEGYAVPRSKDLEPIARHIAMSNPGRKITILGDIIDETGEVDPMATSATQEVGGSLAMPHFYAGRPPAAVNFCDLARAVFPDMVEFSIDAASCKKNATTSKHFACENQWPEIQSLYPTSPRIPFPIYALPDKIRSAVEEVQAFVKAPVPLVVASAISSLSLAAQGLANVRRAEGLVGPCGVYLLTIAESGERKSICDAMFSKPIRDFEHAQMDIARPLLVDFKRKNDAIEARIAGVKEKIKALSKAGKSSSEFDEVLLELERSRPVVPKFPRLIYDNASSEALLYALATEWPSGGMVSAEAGVVFGSHSLSGADSIMRSLALYNQLWDGVDINVDRRTSDSFVVRGARFSMGLQVQPSTLVSFVQKTGDLARGMGFLARFLMAQPESTQGGRYFSDAPESWPHLLRFYARVNDLLCVPLPVNASGVLTPSVLSMSDPAKLAWVEYHDRIENELSAGGSFCEVRDVASKSAENAARLAGLFQIFETGVDAVISVGNFKSAAEISHWYLTESKRFLCESIHPSQNNDAAILEQWLIRRFNETEIDFINKNEIRQFGPSNLRKGLALDSALAELENAGRIRQTKEGRRTAIEVNPGLMFQSA